MLRETRLENKRVSERKERKGAAEYFGANLTHLLNLVQVTDTQDPPPSGRPWLGPPNTTSSWCYSGRLTGPPKHQELLVFGGPIQGLQDGGGSCVSVTCTRFNR